MKSGPGVFGTFSIRAGLSAARDQRLRAESSISIGCHAAKVTQKIGDCAISQGV